MCTRLPSLRSCRVTHALPIPRLGVRPFAHYTFSSPTEDVSALALRVALQLLTACWGWCKITPAGSRRHTEAWVPARGTYPLLGLSAGGSWWPAGRLRHSGATPGSATPGFALCTFLCLTGKKKIQGVFYTSFQADLFYNSKVPWQTPGYCLTGWWSSSSAAVPACSQTTSQAVWGSPFTYPVFKHLGLLTFGCLGFFYRSPTAMNDFTCLDLLRA